MRKTVVLLLGIAATCGWSNIALADRVVLVGGTVIEGKVTKQNGKVVIQSESGEVAVPADSVARIEKAEPGVDRFDARYAALPPGDVRARLELADYCRSHDMRARERKLLLEVIDLDRDNETARARLGFVKTDAGWITQDEAMQAKGFVKEDGRWVNHSSAVEMERLRLEREALAQRREELEAQEHAKRMEAATKQTESDEQRNHLPSSYFDYAFGPYYPVYPGLVPGYVVPRVFPNFRFHPRPAVTSPFSDTSMSVVKVPYRRH
jgi:hypothetical protein